MTMETAAAGAATDTTTGPELVLTRTFDAPRALVYRLWTRPEHLAHWWGPKGFTAPSIEADVRPGGAYRMCIRSAGGTEYWMRGVYRELVEPERLVFTFAWEEEDALETVVTVTLAEQRGRTVLTFHQAPFASDDSRDSHAEGWAECLDRLAAYVDAAGPDAPAG